MKFVVFFFRYLPRYKGRLAFYIISTLLSALFGVFSFTAIIPILNVLFGVADTSIELVPWSDAESIKDIIQIIGNHVMHHLGQQIQSKGANYVLMQSGLFWILMTVIKNCFSYAASLFRAPIRHGIYRDLREDMFNKIIHLPVNFFASAYKGDVMSRVTSDIIEVAAGIKKAFNLLIKDAINILIPLLTLLTISWRMTMISLIVIPIYILLFNKVSKVVQKKTLDAQRLMGANVSNFDQMMDGLRLIKSAAIESRMKEQFKKQNEETKRQYIIRNWIADLSYPLSEVFMTAIAVLILCLGGYSVLSGSSALNGSVFIYFLVVFISMVSPIMSATDAYFGIRQSVACIERINYVLKIDTSIEECSDNDLRQESISSLSMNNVSFGYTTEKLVLSHCNLNINSAGFYAIVGQSGIGKSTLIDLLFRFYDVDAGFITLNEINIKDLSLPSLRHSISYVNQDTFLFNDTILNNLTLGDDSISESDIDKVLNALGLYNLIQSMPAGYNTIVGNHGICLSGGQKQCIAIARAILKDNSLLILDEATSGLDEILESTVLKGVRSIMQEKIVIIISHRVSAIKDANTIFVMNDGKVICEGSHTMLSTKCPYYNKLFNL